MRKRLMTQVSSNLTLFYRLFLPVFFAVFVGALVAFLWLNPSEYYANVRGSTVRYAFTGFFLAVVLLIAFTVWRLRRVEMSREWVYVTDYFRQARYPWSNVARVVETPLGLARVVNVYFHEPGTFGRRATFVASGSRWRLFKDEFPEKLADKLG